MLWLQAGVQLRFVLNESLAEAGHRPGKRDHRQAAHQVVEHVEVDHQLRLRQREVIHQVRQRMDKGQNNQAAHQLKQQAAERHAAGGGVAGAVIEHRQQARAEVGTDHQAQSHREGDRPGGGERGRQQHGGQAGVADDGKHRANQRVEHDVTGQGGEDDLHAVGFGNRGDRLHNQLQRQQDQPQANAHASKLAGPRLFAAEEEDNADKNQQRRQPGEIEGQDTRHQRGTHISPQHNDQRRGQRHQILRHKRGDKQGCGVAALNECRYANACAEGERLLLNAAAENGT